MEFPKNSLRGYNTSRPLRADLETSQKTGQSAIQIGHKPDSHESSTLVLDPIILD